ncbi:MAG: hypothetical protein F6K48_23410 [Okeania sp. SIO3H1]|nr:hypothetical protein [Okeania sp. SIO3H1]
MLITILPTPIPSGGGRVYLLSRERKIDGGMGRWGDGDAPLAPPPPRRGNLGRWGDGEIYIFAQLNVFHINILPRQ